MNPGTDPDASHLKGKSGVTRLINALRYSLRGLRAAFLNESAFRQEVLLAAVLIPLALLLPVSLMHKALLCTSVLWVLVVELLNSAVETTVDRISLEMHDLAGRAKDMGSAAVLISLVACALVWLLVLGDALL